MKGKNDLGKGGFFNSGKERRSEKEGKREKFCKGSKDFKEAIFQEDRSLRSGPKLSSFETTPVFNFCSGPKPVKSGNVVAGELLNPSDFDDFDFNDGSFVAGSNSILPGVMDELVQFWQKGDHQEELVVGDTPPGPPSEVVASPGCSPRFVEGTGGDSICENTSENASRVKLVPMTSVAGGFRAA